MSITGLVKEGDREFLAEYERKSVIANAIHGNVTWEGVPLYVESASKFYPEARLYKSNYNYREDYLLAVVPWEVLDGYTGPIEDILVATISNREWSNQCKSWELNNRLNDARFAVSIESIPGEGKLLLHQNFNWADEMDFNGKAIWEAKEWLEHIQECMAAKWPRTSYLGSNEEKEWDNWEEYIGTFDWSPIPDEEAAIVIKWMGESVGSFEILEDLDYDPDEEDY